MKRSQPKSTRLPLIPKKRSGIRGHRDLNKDADIAKSQQEELMSRYLCEDLALKWGKKSGLSKNRTSELIFHFKKIGSELAVVPPITLPCGSDQQRATSINSQLKTLSTRTDLTNSERRCLKNWESLQENRKQIVVPKRLYDWCVLIRDGHSAATLKPGDQQRAVWRRMFDKGFNRQVRGTKKVKMKPEAIRWLFSRLSREALRKINDNPRSSVFSTELLNSALQAWLLLQPAPRNLIRFLEEAFDRLESYDPARKIILNAMATGKDLQNEDEDAFMKEHLAEHSLRAKKNLKRFLNDERTRIRSIVTR